MKMTEEQKAKAKVYRDTMSEEQKERLRHSKRIYGAKMRDEVKVYRAMYYAANKESMNEASRAYHQKARELKASTFQQRERKPTTQRVLNQPANMVTLKEIADQLGVIVALIRAISKDERYSMPKYQLLRIDGAELYDRYEITRWIIDNNEMLVSLTITGMNRKNKGEVKLSKNVMLLVNWMQKSKHVVKHCLTQRKANKLLWSKYA